MLAPQTRTAESVARACVALLAGSALFAAWISLVPFEFVWPGTDSVRAAIAGALEWQIFSRANFLANILLFVPVGFFAAGAVLVQRHPPIRVAGRSLLLFLGSIALSAAIEAAQILVPSRTAALSDVVAQTLGSGLGMAAWLTVRSELIRLFALPGPGGQYALVQRALAVYTLGRAIALLLPLDVTVSAGLLWQKYRHGGIRLVPFSGWDPATGLSDAATTILLSAPIGALALLGVTGGRQRHSIPTALVLSFVAVFSFECGQVLVLSRVADATDIVVSWVGAAAGVWGAAILTGSNAPAKSHDPTRWVYLGAIALSAATCILYSWTPFDFEPSVPLVRERLPALLQVPLYSYYIGTELQSLSTLAMKFTMAVPLGFFGRLAMTTASSLDFIRLRLAAMTLAVAAFFLLIEAGQLLLPSRYPDGTDVLIGMLGFAAGTIAAGVVSRRHA